MAYKHVVRVSAACPKHRSYNPEVGGPGAIKGGCEHCTALWEAYRKVFQFEREIGALVGNISAAKKTKKTKEAA